MLKNQYLKDIHYNLVINLYKMYNLCNFHETSIVNLLLSKERLDHSIIEYKDTLQQLTVNIIHYLEKYELIYIFQKRNFYIYDFNIHFGIVPKYKKHPEYKKLFCSKSNHFVGLSKSNLHKDYLIISNGSWNHNYKKHYPIIENRRKKLGISFNSYNINRNCKQITIFVQNYSEKEYWFGWEDNDLYIWIKREKHVLNMLLKEIVFDYSIYIKFHPKMPKEYIEYFKNNIGLDVLKYYELDETMEKVATESYCCIVNSGFSAVELCILGIPLFYLDDYYSTIPMKYFAIKDFKKIINFEIIDLPCQEQAMDFITSQMFHVEETPKIIFEEYIQKC